ncbi:acyl-CoA dehydrogenase family protein [Streptomyces daliensis]|uniref:Acyl-CoA dehydrogenase family protein n=1 Tax=Streptomyces daliensis TaxID=299421 RepID=A0A8T4II24_9ACTN|nr:acyl-CoA dehydrogenase family protein [Streptomyces daliensis]
MGDLMDVAAFADAARAEADAWDRAGRLPGDIVKAMAAGGLLGADLPRDYGGAAASARELGEACARLGGVCSALRGLVTVQGMVASALLRWGTGEQRTAWLPALAAGDRLAGFAATEEGAGSDLGALTTSVRAHGTGYAVTGRKLWVTFGTIADVFLVIGRTEDRTAAGGAGEEGAGEPDGGHGRTAALLVESDRPGVTVEPVGEPFGMRAAGLAHVTFDEVRVPASHLVAPPGFGLSHVAAAAIDHGRHTVAWGCTGLAEACLTYAARHTARRTQGGVRLADHQAVRAVLGRAQVAAAGARQLCGHAADLRDRRSPEALAETVVAKYAAASAAASVSQDTFQLHGSAACGPDSAVGRLFRDARIMQIIEGSREVAEVLIGDLVLRRGGPGTAS